MLIKCKHCGKGDAVKNGKVRGKQRYECKSCGKTFRAGDLREKYTNEQRLRVIKWYLEGIGIMSIERMEGVPNPLIIQWVRKFSKILRQRLNEVEIPDDVKKIQIVELRRAARLLPKKTNKVYVWLAVDRVRGKVVDFEVMESRRFRAYLPMAMRLKERYDTRIKKLT